MRALLCAVLVALATLGTIRPVAAAPLPPEAASVVSMSVTYQFYDPILPWGKDAEQSLRGNALVVQGNRLLTTANLVKNASLIEVRAFGGYPDYVARPVKVDYELDLALLAVDNPDFWADLEPLPLDHRGLETGHFTINRWRPNGRYEQGAGDVVDFRAATSRFGRMEFPALRARVNMAELGRAEMLTHEGRIVGMATGQGDQEIEAVSAAVLKAFAEDGPEAFAHRGFGWQRLNHPALRQAVGARQAPLGVLVATLMPGGSGHQDLQRDDIITHINGYAINPEGFIEHPVYGQIEFSAMLNGEPGETLTVRLWRDGEAHTVDLARRRFQPEDYRVWPHVFDEQPDFEVFRGLVFQELSVTYLQAWGNNWEDDAPTRLVMEAQMNPMATESNGVDRVVFISRVLQDPVNLGYDSINQGIVQQANGRPVTSLAALREALAHPQGGFHVLRLLPGTGREHLVFPAGAMPRINERIRQRYAIPDQSATMAEPMPSTADSPVLTDD